MPDKTPTFWTLERVYQQEPDGSYVAYVMRGEEGGVSFKSKGNWTQITPVPSTTTQVLNQLALSAGLGQEAVQAAQSGNLENARYLADLSAQAMNGSLSKSDLAKINIPVPQGATGPVLPDSVQLQKEILKKTHQQIAVMIQNPTASGAASATLNQINNLYEQVRNNPAAASEYLVKLQTGQLSSTPPPAKPPERKPESIRRSRRHV